MNCRFCDERLEHLFLDLGDIPLANSFLKSEKIKTQEMRYSLKVFVCSKCFLAQLETNINPSELFRDYIYLSSFSDSWLEHCKNYSDMIVEKFQIEKNSTVIEIASNDGYLLNFFKKIGRAHV